MDESKENIVLVRIFGSALATGACGCGSSCCGPKEATVEPADSRSLEEQAADLGITLTKYYGSGVRVEYVDIFSEAMAAYPEVMGLIVERGLPLPLTTVNGDLRFAGSLPLDRISAEVETHGVEPVIDGKTQG